MAKAWLVHTGEDSDVVASTQEIAINWLLEHGYARLDDEPLDKTIRSRVYMDNEPLVVSYNTETHKWEKWAMVRVAEYLGCSPREALVKLLNDIVEEDIFNWAVWLEPVEWIG